MKEGLYNTILDGARGSINLIGLAWGVAERQSGVDFEEMRNKAWYILKKNLVDNKEQLNRTSIYEWNY